MLHNPSLCSQMCLQAHAHTCTLLKIHGPNPGFLVAVQRTRGPRLETAPKLHRRCRASAAAFVARGPRTRCTVAITPRRRRRKRAPRPESRVRECKCRSAALITVRTKTSSKQRDSSLRLPFAIALSAKTAEQRRNRTQRNATNLNRSVTDRAVWSFTTLEALLQGKALPDPSSGRISRPLAGVAANPAEVESLQCAAPV